MYLSAYQVFLAANLEFIFQENVFLPQRQQICAFYSEIEISFPK